MVSLFCRGVESCGAYEARLRGSCPCDPMDGLDGLHKIANSASELHPADKVCHTAGPGQAVRGPFWEKLIRLLSGILVLESRQTNSLFFHG